jgi:hypothetical protein
MTVPIVTRGAMSLDDRLAGETVEPCHDVVAD